MTKRIPLSQRTLPAYSRGEEIMNMTTHIAGGALAVVVLLLCLSGTRGIAAVSCGIYGAAMLAVYTVSSVYHGLLPGMGKKVMQVVDHCAIYFLIAGTYTPILLCAILPHYPAIGWGLLAAQWVLCFLAAALTAIDLKKYSAFSMVCYICMGWGIMAFPRQAWLSIGRPGFLWLLAGGIAYTAGAILYGIGAKKRWMHSVFHIFVVLGSLLQFLSIYLHILDL